MKENAGDINRSRAMIADKIKEFKREEKMKKVEYENEMIKIYTKVFQRPLLVESGGQKRRGRRKRVQASMVLTAASSSRKRR